MSRVSTLDALKIQARAVAPIVRALEARLGREEAYSLVGSAVAEAWADHVAGGFTGSERPADMASPFSTEAIIVTDADDEYRVDMTRCESADYFRNKGMPEIGALLSCGVDFAVERLRCPDWDFSRTQTLMMGADRCDFCWKKKSP